ncbi:hypothetical protein GGR55DRAFT_616335 [Xylaria sp. FL0064]|nr:hypothetical protein GGR55DRAFT_616335 [Xylaria sp. FL0064]
MPAIDTDVKAVQKMFDVNVFGPMRIVHHFHDMLIQSSGTIVNMSSIGAIVPYVYGSSYNATKAALAHWGEVGTNILKNDHGRALPEATTDRFSFAKRVVDKTVTASPPAWFWTGSQTGVIRFLDMFFPRTVFDWLFWNMFDLGKLRQFHKASRKDASGQVRIVSRSL